MPKRPPLTPLGLWILLCALLNASGWTLSAIGQLNVAGYSFVLLAAGGASFYWWRQTRPGFNSGFRVRRFKRLFPLAFTLIAVLALLGGIIHPPTNYDALAYRTPRVLHWFAEGRWHWIHTDFQRLNTRGAGMEWMTAPLLAFTRTDRLFFLVNAISFLLLPGLCFRILRALGVRHKVAWHWMWILPTGYCYILQAGSIGNDLFGATLSLAAIDYALRASRTRDLALASMSIIAAALATSVKAFNMLLFIPWVCAMAPTIVPLLKRPLASVPLCLFAILVSIIPTSALNHYHCGDWKGTSAEPVKLSTGAPGFHLGINALLLTLHHLNPPVNPLAGSWNAWTARTIPHSWQEHIGEYFETSVRTFNLGEMQMEEAAGLGLGIVLLVLPVVAYRHRFRPNGVTLRSHASAVLHQRNLIPLGAALAILYFLTQSGLGCPARYLAPFYVMLLAPVLRLDRASQVISRKWWRALALIAFVMAATLLIATPPRPLWPAVSVLRMMGAEQSSSTILKRAWNVYSVYGERAAGFEPALDLLPPETSRLGLVTFDDPETSLWKPFGSRRILHVTRNDDAQSLRDRNIDHVLVSAYVIENLQTTTIGDWLERHDAEILHTFDMTLRATRGPTAWHLVRIRPASS